METIKKLFGYQSEPVEKELEPLMLQNEIIEAPNGTQETHLGQSAPIDKAAAYDALLIEHTKLLIEYKEVLAENENLKNSRGFINIQKEPFPLASPDLNNFRLFSRTNTPINDSDSDDDMPPLIPCGTGSWSHTTAEPLGNFRPMSPINYGGPIRDRGFESPFTTPVSIWNEPLQGSSGLLFGPGNPQFDRLNFKNKFSVRFDPYINDPDNDTMFKNKYE